MISGFFTTLKNDIVYLNRCLSEENDLNENKKAKLAAVRILAAFGMLWGGLQMFSSLFGVKTRITSEKAGGLLAGIASYVLSHDVFTMCRNQEKNVFKKGKILADKVTNGISGFFHKISEKGRKLFESSEEDESMTLNNLKDKIAITMLTHETLVPFFWNWLILNLRNE